MAYQKSRARKQLTTAYSGISNRLKLADTGKVHTSLREYVISAAIFLAHAELENFVADIVSSFAQGVQVRISTGSELPGYLRSHLFLAKANAIRIIGALAAGGSEGDLLRKFEAALKSDAGSMVNDIKPLAPFTGKDVFGTLKYPSEANLKKIFYRIGIDDLFNQLSSYLKQDAVALLESLGSLRTQLAHTGVVPGISCKDVRDRLKDAERFVGALDRLVFKTTVENMGNAIWRSHLC